MVQEEHKLGWMIAGTVWGKDLLPREGILEMHDIEIKVFTSDLLHVGGLGREDCGECNGGRFLFKEDINRHDLVSKLFEWFE